MPCASTSSSNGHHNLWKLIWHIPAPPKIKMFLWRLSNNAIATSLNLFNRKCAQSPVCQICFQERESTEHMLFRCSWTIPVWFACPLSLRPPSLDNYASVQSALMSKISLASKKIALGFLATFALTSWAIWKAKNANIFEDIPINPALTHKFKSSFFL
ncbi:hypothetical protein POM88_052206 [Heracleum sosnowskyi]|uniref:Reverse transcriptase zinc-binding domain-containing protein n=1 Tax=Heracleum sosnowskyi TaxID=360622 RepID=A0AAD8GSL3_9APIA|nr:hypothetical protein POM88_052206 [Heracleum sosnowskyi]